MPKSYAERTSQQPEQAAEAEEFKPEVGFAKSGNGFDSADESNMKGGGPAGPRRVTRSNILALQRTIGNQAVMRLLAAKASHPTSPPLTKADNLTSEIQRTPEGWDKTNEDTMKPAFYEAKGHSYGLINEALKELNLDDDKERKIANQWGKFAIDHGYVGKGPVKSTYKSTYDYAPNDFSVSQKVPMLDTFVVHAHIKSDDTVALDGGVNLKYSSNEGGMKAANVPADSAKEVIDVESAKKEWFSDANRERRQDVEERYLFWKMDELFKEDGNPPALAPAPAPVVPPKFEPDFATLREGAALAKTPANFWKMVNAAIEQARKGDTRTYDTYIQAIKDKKDQG
jgi:hypothetical protein